MLINEIDQILPQYETTCNSVSLSLVRKESAGIEN